MSGRFVLVNPHEITAPGVAVKVTVDDVDEVTCTPVHALNVDTHPGWIVSASV